MHNFIFLGTKAISNVTEQFSKLNKFGYTLTGKKPTHIVKSFRKKECDIVDKAVFTVGSRDIHGNVNDKSSSNSDSDENIASAHVYIPKPEKFEHDIKLMEAYTPTIGIIMGMKTDVLVDDVRENNLLVAGSKQESELSKLQHSTSNSNIEYERTNVTTPEITINAVKENVEKEKVIPPASLNFLKINSHSSSEVDGSKSNNTQHTDDTKMYDKKRSTSEQDLILNISYSQSESALKSMNIGNEHILSPISLTTKELLSPFSKFAKGVQTLGANLDPRKLKTGPIGMARNLSDNHLEQRQKLQERWNKCNSKLIAL